MLEKCLEVLKVNEKQNHREGMGNLVEGLKINKKKVNESGYCFCGCGNKTNIATDTRRSIQIHKGDHMRYIYGHRGRLNNPYTVSENGCWIWNGHIRRNGYPSGITYKGKVDSAHRVFYRRFKGEIPKGMCLDHLCRKRSCVNPDHLEIVSCTENTRRGLATKLRKMDIPIIFKMEKTGVIHRNIAIKFGVNRSHISAIIRGERWKN